MGGAIGFFLIVILGGTLFLTGLNSLGGKKGSDFFVAPKLTDLFSLPAPPSGGAPSISTVKVPEEPSGLRPVRLQEQGGGSSYNYYTDPSLPKPPQGFTQNQLSPYYGKVSINSFSPYRSSFSLGGFSLFATYQSKEPIDVTGWKLRSNLGESVEILKAVSDYDPLGGDRPADIIVQAGDSLEAYTTTPAFVQNVRLNKCMGYLNNHMKTDPAFPRNCPAEVERRDVVTLPGQCQDFLLSLSSCDEPTIKTFNDPNVTHQCIRFVQDRLNYESCYRKHRGEADFFSKVWRVWLGPVFFDKTHDRVQLLDKDGRLVDVYTY